MEGLEKCVFEWKKNEILLRRKENIYCKCWNCWNELKKELAFASFSVQRIAEKKHEIPNRREQIVAIVSIKNPVEHILVSDCALRLALFEVKEAVDVAGCQNGETNCDENKGQVEKQVVSLSCEIIQFEGKITQKKANYGCEKVHHRTKFVEPQRNNHSHTSVICIFDLINYGTKF